MGLSKRKFDFYEGVVNNLERRYMETSSSFMREWIENLMSDLACKKCKGKRLSQEALSVLIDGKNINDFTDLSIQEALNLFKI